MVLSNKVLEVRLLYMTDRWEFYVHSCMQLFLMDDEGDWSQFTSPVVTLDQKKDFHLNLLVVYY